MTDLLQRAFQEASKLSEEEQNALAAWLLREMASERKWSEAMADSRDQLADLAREALDDYRQGRTRDLDTEGP